MVSESAPTLADFSTEEAGMWAALAAVAVAVAVPGGTDVEAAPYWKQRGCDHGHRSAVAYKQVRRLVRNTNPRVRQDRVQHWAGCLATRAKVHEAHRRARGHWRWRHSYPQVFAIRTNRFPGWVRGYLAALRPCEGGHHGYAADTGNSFFGAYQFTWGTWASVGGSGNPAHAAPAEQDYRAGVLLTTSGPQHWPNCP